MPRAAPLPDTNLAMLKEALKVECQATPEHTKRTKEAEEFGDKAPVVQLENFICD